MKSNFERIAKQVERDLGLELVRNRSGDATTPRDIFGKPLSYSICASHGLGAWVRHNSFHTLADVARHLEQEEIKRS